MKGTVPVIGLAITLAAASLISHPADAASKTYQTSSDCSKATSGTAWTICHDPELAALDKKLLPLFLEGRKLAAGWNTTDGEGSPFSDWFAEDAKRELAWRENNCQDKPCLLKWYARRRALLGFITNSPEGLGEDGTEATANFRTIGLL